MEIQCLFCESCGFGALQLGQALCLAWNASSLQSHSHVMKRVQ